MNINGLKNTKFPIEKGTVHYRIWDELILIDQLMEYKFEYIYSNVGKFLVAIL